MCKVSAEKKFYYTQEGVREREYTLYLWIYVKFYFAVYYWRQYWK